MAECTVLPSLVHSRVRREQGGAVVTRSGRFSSVWLPRILHDKKENCVALSSRNSSRTTLEGTRHHEWRKSKCHCIGSLVNPEGLTPQWVPVINQVLLAISIVLAYVGGVIPDKKTLNTSRKNKIEQDIAIRESTSSGRDTEKILPLNVRELWNAIGDKLTEALKANDYDDYVELRKSSSNISLSLLAVAEHPRTRLLYITLQRLQTEVMNSLPSYSGIGREDWLAESCQILGRVTKPACVQWLESEASVKNVDKDFFAKTLNKVQGSDSAIESLKKTGKLELYADMLYFIRFGSLCNGHIFGNNFLIKHGVDVLEDLVIGLADGISCLYLELISIDSSISEEINSLDFNLCLLPTRELQRIRNEVALRQWIIQNFQSVSSMYEDRFDLFVLRAHYHERPAKKVSQEANWWRKLSPVSQESTLLSSLQIKQAPVRVRRTKELRALTGWRYYYSLFLELSDVAMPLVKVVVDKGRDAITFLLTCLIGRSLGLIYTGIRGALGFR